MSDKHTIVNMILLRRVYHANRLIARLHSNIFTAELVSIRFFLVPFLATIMASPAGTSIFRQEEQGKKVVAGNSEFAWNLFRKLSSERPADNVFMSPTSISLALALTYLGARGETQQQMKAALGFAGVDDEHLHGCLQDLAAALKNADGKYSLHLANQLFGEQSYRFLSPFLDATKSYYDAPLEPVDYVRDAAGARTRINAWVEQQTHGKIADLVGDGVLDSLTRLVLVNAIYFKGDWQQKFDVKNTQPGQFEVSRNEKIPVDYMYQEKKFSYGWSRDVSAKVVELPYVAGSPDRELTLLLLLPDQVHGLADVEAKLTPQMLANPEQAFRMTSVKTQVKIPRFKVSGSFSLSDTLAGLGMPHLFDGSKADLSGMDGTRELFISKVLHKAFIEVNEEGSEAAAATAVVAQLRSMPRIMEFTAFQPFLAMVRHKATGTILFLGRVTRPEAAAAPAGEKQEL